MVRRLEVEVRVSRMQGDQRDESQGWKEKKFELLRSAHRVIGSMTAEERERKRMKGFPKAKSRQRWRDGETDEREIHTYKACKGTNQREAADKWMDGLTGRRMPSCLQGNGII